MKFEEVTGGEAELAKIKNGIRHGVVLKLGIPADMRWDFEFAL